MSRIPIGSQFLGGDFAGPQVHARYDNGLIPHVPAHREQKRRALGAYVSQTDARAVAALVELSNEGRDLDEFESADRVRIGVAGMGDDLFGSPGQGPGSHPVPALFEASSASRSAVTDGSPSEGLVLCPSLTSQSPCTTT